MPAQSLVVTAYFDRRQDLIRFFAARLRSESRAEDLIQELYIKVSELDPATPVDNPSALLFRIANNLMLDRLRSETRSVKREQDWAGHSGAAETLSTDEPSPETAAGDRQTLRLLMRALEGLAPRTRRAFELHKLRGLSYAETAREMGTSQKTIEKQIGAALRQLAARLGRDDDT